MSVFTITKNIFVYCSTCECPLAFSERYGNSVYIHPCEVCNTLAEDEAHEQGAGNEIRGG